MSNVLVKGSVIDQTLRIVCDGLAKSQNGGNIEVSGLLLGREMENSIVITSAVTGGQVSTSYGSVLDDNFIAAVAHYAMTGKIGGRIVGMFHSHPGIGIFMSSQDTRTLFNFQRLYSGFVMMVIDPLTTERWRFFRYDSEAGTVRILRVEVVG